MRIPAATFALLALSTWAFAADSPADHESHCPQRMERLATLLDLNDYQKTQVQAILEGQRKALHEQREATRKETLEKLTPVLSEAQLKKFEAHSHR